MNVTLSREFELDAVISVDDGYHRAESHLLLITVEVAGELRYAFEGFMSSIEAWLSEHVRGRDLAGVFRFEINAYTLADYLDSVLRGLGVEHQALSVTLDADTATLRLQ